jgi:adenylate kinase family enzyme
MKKERLGFHLVLLGQIASGKDTQAELLLKRYNLTPVESGKYWRAKEKEKSPDGEWLRRTTRLGKPAPVALMKKFLLKNIENRPKNKDLIFVGNPRLKPEAQLLKKLLAFHKENFFVLYISLPDKEVFGRSLSRVRGADDNITYIQGRLKWHKDQVSKTIAYFDSLGKLKKINGNQSVEKVTTDIEKALRSFQKLNNEKTK